MIKKVKDFLTGVLGLLFLFVAIDLFIMGGTVSLLVLPMIGVPVSVILAIVGIVTLCVLVCTWLAKKRGEI